MFSIEDMDKDRPEGQPETIELMQKITKEGTELLCKVAVILATQGELCRRYLQHSPERIPTDQELLLLLTPLQMLGLRSAVVRAIHAGWNQTETEADEDIDTGLAELEKKTKP